MKYIVLSFDDGRYDFVKNAMPVLIAGRIPATLNVITGVLDGKTQLNGFSSEKKFIDENDLLFIQNNNFEIANHSSKHTNNVGDIKTALSYLQNRLNLKKIGFASPHSEIYYKNFSKFANLLSEDTLYIRSGNQFKRDGYLHLVIYLLFRFIHFESFFYIYNKRNIIDLKKKYKFYPSITWNCEIDNKSIKAIVNKMHDNQAIILNIHSVLAKHDFGYGKDKWFIDLDEFKSFIHWVKSYNDLKIVTNQELFYINQKLVLI